MIRMENVTIQYNNNIILNNINWQVNPGECWQIKGHNGAGKSTLLSLINGDNPQAYAQQIYLFGKKRGSGESIWDIKKKIGFVSPELYNFLIVIRLLNKLLALVSLILSVCSEN